MNIRSASVIIYQDKAYVPTEAQMETGPYLAIEPVYVAGLTPEEIAQALAQAIAAGHPRVPGMTRDEFRKRRDPILKATKARSWKELYQKGGVYGIEFREDEILIYTHSEDPLKVGNILRFPSDASLRDLAEAILNNFRARKAGSGAQA